MTLIATQTTEDVHDLPRVARSRRSAWVGGIIVACILVYLIVGAALTPGFRWNVVREYLFDPRILGGAVVSIAMTAVTMVLALVLGALVAVMRLSSILPVSMLARGFIWVFRSVPMLVQLLFWYNIAALLPQLGIGLPGLPPLLGLNTNHVISPLTAAVIGLTLHETAFVAEIYRSGFSAVPTGQREAAAALGISPARAFLRIVFPQALRIVVPTIGNETIALLKATSLVSVIALSDLLYSVQLIYSQNYETIPLLVVACVWYMVITGALSALQNVVEKRLGNRLVRKRPRLSVKGTMA
jgi:polar amino acid transport system permease protein